MSESAENWATQVALIVSVVLNGIGMLLYRIQSSRCTRLNCGCIHCERVLSDNAQRPASPTEFTGISVATPTPPASPPGPYGDGFVVRGHPGVYAREEKIKLVSQGAPFYVGGASRDMFSFIPNAYTSVHRLMGKIEGEPFENEDDENFIKVVKDYSGKEWALMHNRGHTLNWYIESVSDGLGEVWYEPDVTVEIVINECFGGFGLSEAGVEFMRANGRPNTKYARGIARHDKVLVECVKTLGAKAASGRCAWLVIVKVVGSKYKIHEYDGFEEISTPYDVDYIDAYEPEPITAKGPPAVPERKLKPAKNVCKCCKETGCDRGCDWPGGYCLGQSCACCRYRVDMKEEADALNKLEAMLSDNGTSA